MLPTRKETLNLTTKSEIFNTHKKTPANAGVLKEFFIFRID
jgi:hypothetical protein